LKITKSNIDAGRSSRLKMPGRIEDEFSSDRMTAKCAIFDARNTIAAFRGNAIGKMNFFEANNQSVDLSREKDTFLGINARHKPPEIRKFAPIEGPKATEQ
jgi:hypothetical protein